MLIRTIIEGHLAFAFDRFRRAVTARETATTVTAQAQHRAHLALQYVEDRERDAVCAEKLLDDAQTEYEASTAELTRALGGKAFDPATGDLI